MDSAPQRVSVMGAHVDDGMREAVVAAGAPVVPHADATALVWTGGSVPELEDALAGTRQLQWVQLPSAGVEEYASLIQKHPDIVWTCAKGIYGAAVAEHALAMLLALRRGLPSHAVARQWTPAVRSRPLVGSGDIVTLLGAGGIGVHIAQLLAPFGLRVRVLRRRAEEGFAAAHEQVYGEDELHEALTGAAALMISSPLTERTRGMVGERELRLLAPSAVVVNVGRGAVLDHEALATALDERRLGGAGLDVTDPEPLPPDSRLWSHPRSLITSHTANPDAWRREQLLDLIRDNVARHMDGRDLRGRVTSSDGY